MSEKKNLDAVLIGCGMISRFHVEAIRATEGIELIGVCDRNAELAHKLAVEESGNIKVYSDTADVWTSDADVVIICTPSGTHANLVLSALRAKKHVIVEKPMAMTSEECAEILAAEAETGKICAPISQHRFAEDILYAKQLIDEGKIGQPIFASVSMQYHRDKEYYAASPWRGSVAMDGGVLMNQGIHGIDVLCFLMGYPKAALGICRTLHHKIEAEDTAVSALEFPNGALGFIGGSTATYPGKPRRTEVCGTLGSILMENDRLVYAIDAPYERKDAPTAGGHSNPAAIGVEGHTRQYRDIVAALHGEKELFYTSKDAAGTVGLINAIGRSSAADGKKIVF